MPFYLLIYIPRPFWWCFFYFCLSGLCRKVFHQYRSQIQFTLFTNLQSISYFVWFGWMDERSFGWVDSTCTLVFINNLMYHFTNEWVWAAKLFLERNMWAYKAFWMTGWLRMWMGECVCRDDTECRLARPRLTGSCSCRLGDVTIQYQSPPPFIPSSMLPYNHIRGRVGASWAMRRKK